MLNVYKVLSENISNAVSINGNQTPTYCTCTCMFHTCNHFVCICACDKYMLYACVCAVQYCLSVGFSPLLGELVTRQPLIASMRVVKKETLKLISSWVSRSSDPGMVRIYMYMCVGETTYTLDIRVIYMYVILVYSSVTYM